MPQSLTDEVSLVDVPGVDIDGTLRSVHLEVVGENLQVSLQPKPKVPAVGGEGEVDGVVEGTFRPRVCSVHHLGIVGKGFVVGDVLVQTVPWGKN